MNSGYSNLWLVKVNSAGDTLWTRTFGGSDITVGYSVQQTSDGGFVVAGYTESFGTESGDVWLIRTDANGDTLWTRTYGGISDDYGYSVQQTSDSGFVVVGVTYSFGAGASDVYLIRTDASGDTLWTRTFGGSSSDYGRSVQQTSDGGFVVAGYTYSFGASGDVYLIRTDPNGDILWTRTYGGSGSDYGNSVQQTSDGGFVVAGYSESFGAGNYDIWLIRLGAGGILQEPIITAVTDVPEDQGNRVYLSWSASYHELFESIIQYGIKIQNPEGQWVDIGTVSARQANSYTYLADTFGDSTATGTVWSRFQVTAHTSNSALYYTSPVDSGYSIDNLAPAAPTGLVASVTEGLAVSLAWNGPVDYDFKFFRVYRMATVDAVATTLIEISETTFSDTTVEESQSYEYWLTAVDINGNESEQSQALSVTVLGLEGGPGLPTEFALHPNYPNPFNPSTTMAYDLPQAGPVALVVYDLRGREVARLAEGRREAGYYQG